MCPKTVVQNKIIRQEKKDLILRTALIVFAQEGYHASSVNKIADKANISKGLIYNYFESKEDLLRNIITNIMDRYMEKYPPIDSIPNDSHIEYFIDQSFEFILEDSAKYELQNVDLLFIDSLHNREHLREELKNHTNVGRLIVMHDTETFKELGDQGGGLKFEIDNFLDKNPEWTVLYEFKHNNGMMVLSKI